MTRPLTQRLAQFATAGAVTAFASGLARHHPDGSTAAESGFLALVLGITLGALALSGRTASAVVPGGVLIALALCLPAAEGTRGALVMALLVATVGFATWRIVAGEPRPAFLDIAALAIAWQCLLRSARLLEWQGYSPRSMVWLLGLPLAAAVAAWWLGRRHGGLNVLVLLAALATLAPGLGVVPVAVLVVVAALTGEHGRSWQAAAVATGAAVVAIGWMPPVAPAMLVLVAALALRHVGRGAWLPAAGALGWALVTIIATGGSFNAIAGLGWLLLTLPLVALSPPATRPLALAALALALTHGSAAEPALLAPAWALAALALPIERSSRGLQAGWSLALLAFVAVSASYPWLRRPLGEWLAGTDLLVLGVSALVLGVAVVYAAQKRPAAQLWSTALVLFGLILAIAVQRRPQRLNIEPIVLTVGNQTWEADAPEGAVRALEVGSLVNGSQTLSPGQPIAYLLLETVGGGRQWQALRYGRDTADWAARRHVEQGQTPSFPPPWLTWFGGDGSLAQRYRGEWQLASPLALEHIGLVRAKELAPEVEITILSVAAR